MKQKLKSELARQRILDAALREFSSKGYEGASLNAACAENGISKGIVYHHFKDKNELYLMCVQMCFDSLTDYLQAAMETFSGTPEERLRSYFGARLRFFAEHPLYLSLCADAAFQPPAELAEEIRIRREELDKLSLSVLTALLEKNKLRNGFSISTISEDFRMYMDYFNIRFRDALHQGSLPEQVLREHEERCRQQIDILLHGILFE